jgi:glutaconate CoA-transferase subunit B
MGGKGPQVVITDLGVLKPAPGSEELQLVARFENARVEDAGKATGWPLQIAERLEVVEPPSDEELRILRDLHERTRLAHARPVELPVQKGTP